MVPSANSLTGRTNFAKCPGIQSIKPRSVGRFGFLVPVHMASAAALFTQNFPAPELPPPPARLAQKVHQCSNGLMAVPAR